VTELITGLSLGLGAGISPGPLLTLVVISSLERGFAAGLRVAVAPLLTDAPIVAVALLFVSSIPESVLRGLGMAGGIVVIGLGLATIRGSTRPALPAGEQPPARDLWRGVAVNVLSPHPWVFWLTAGGPLLVAAWRRSPAIGAAFVAGFYLLLVGSKVVIAVLVAGAGHRLGHVARRRLVAVGGALLVFGGALLLWQASAGRL
jgi:threonine/homoserine/homoserine lactone efflux protein